MKPNPFYRLLAFLERLEQVKVAYTLRHSREDALMVVAYAPGEYWEIDFLQSGEIEIERYRSDGHIADASVLEQIFAAWSEENDNAEPTENRNAIRARK